MRKERATPSDPFRPMAHPILRSAAAAGALLAATLPAFGGGTLTPIGSPDEPIQILDHHVEVHVQDGFARTEVTQSFFNPNGIDLEAIYRVPVPEGACLSEMEILLGEQVLSGEVIARSDARAVYEKERDSGRDAGLAEQQGTQVFDFHVTPVPAGGEASFRYLYYEPLELDTGVGRYLYPLEDGGTDERALAFWTSESEVRRSFSFHARVESAWPIDEVRLPGFDGLAQPVKIDEGVWDVTWSVPGGVFTDRDLVLYWRLADDLPGRMELITYRDDANEPGTFQLVLTPGVDLAPLTGGIDTTFVLDVSGSMKGKLQTLADGVGRAIGELRPEDRFRVITFSDSATDRTRGFLPASADNVAAALDDLQRLRSQNSTNLYAGLALAQEDLDDDRANVLVLVTDGVTNTGIVDPVRFEALMLSVDVRLFGFLLGNSGNWPLMRAIAEASGGTYSQVSNADDVLGALLLAKSKVTHEALTDVDVSIEGVRVFDAGLGPKGKLFRGQQLVLFGRYAEPGPARIELQATVTGKDQVYAADVVFPAFDTDHPELERMWAMDRIDRWQLDMDLGRLQASEGEQAIRDLAVAYQLVTEETSMLVVSDEIFDAHGIARANRDRVASERTAQSSRVGQVPTNHRVDVNRPAFPDKAPRLSGGNGGGSFGALALGLVLLAAVGATRFRRVRPVPSDDDAGPAPWNGYDTER